MEGSRKDIKRERRENIVRADSREQTVVSNETVREHVYEYEDVCVHSLELRVCRVLALVQ